MLSLLQEVQHYWDNLVQETGQACAHVQREHHAAQKLAVLVNLFEFWQD